MDEMYLVDVKQTYWYRIKNYIYKVTAKSFPIELRKSWATNAVKNNKTLQKSGRPKPSWKCQTSTKWIFTSRLKIYPDSKVSALCFSLIVSSDSRITMYRQLWPIDNVPVSNNKSLPTWTKKTSLLKKTIESIKNWQNKKYVQATLTLQPNSKRISSISWSVSIYPTLSSLNFWSF
jgi:hypothetical protein